MLHSTYSSEGECCGFSCWNASPKFLDYDWENSSPSEWNGSLFQVYLSSRPQKPDLWGREWELPGFKVRQIIVGKANCLDARNGASHL